VKLRTAHTQQIPLLLEDNAGCYNQRQAFITDLEKIINSLTVDKKHNVILGIDANETLCDEISEIVILGLVERYGIINIMASMSPDAPPLDKMQFH
jgi:uncharacterized protein Yka (UPF0111/DUF47 family)